MTNAKEFKLELQTASKKILGEDFSKFIRLLTLEVLRRVVLKTPVRTGRARGGWDVCIGAESDGETFSSDPVSNGLAKLPPLMSMNEVIYVLNNVVYILALENGHSKQAPVGMVAVTLAELNSLVM
jgi:hypothetical protein